MNGRTERPMRDQSPFRWWYLPLLTVMAPLLFLLFLPWGIFVIYKEHVERDRERQLRRRLAANGRLIRWTSVEPRLTAGDGTLFVEGRDRLWWTNEKVLAEVAWRSANDAHLCGSRRPLDLLKWSARRHLGPRSGKALLISEFPIELAAELVGSDFDGIAAKFKTRFPNVRVIEFRRRIP